MEGVTFRSVTWRPVTWQPTSWRRLALTTAAAVARLVGWAWVDAYSGEVLAGNMRVTVTPTTPTEAAIYVAEGPAYTTAQVYQFSDTAPFPDAPRFYIVSRLSPTAIKIDNWNRLHGSGTLVDIGRNQFLILAYANTGGRVLTEVGWAWVNAAGTLRDGSPGISVARLASGRFEITSPSNYTVAHASMFTAADVGSVPEAFVWAGKVGPAICGVRVCDRGGNAADTDFLLRLLA